MGLKDQNWSHFLRRENRGERERKRKKKKRRRGRRDQANQGMELWIFGMETHLDYKFYVIMYEFPCLVG